jgi:cyclophilin family peptidyl-prolyl cis-trans isomerase
MIRLTAGFLVVALIAVGAFAIAGGGDDGGDNGNGTASQSGNDAGADQTPEPPSEQTPQGIPVDAACGAEPPPEASPKTDYKAPDQVLEEGIDYGAVFTTSCGEIEVDLLEEQAPETVNSFVFLAREGYFDGLIFHRIIQDFVIQSGDPDGLNGNPPDGPGYSIPDELPERSKDYVFGALAMANSGPDSGGSQFFFVVSKAAAGLQPDYSIFGQASKDSGETMLEIAGQETIGGSDPARAEMPRESVYIESIEITEN